MSFLLFFDYKSAFVHIKMEIYFSNYEIMLHNNIYFFHFCHTQVRIKLAIRKA